MARERVIKGDGPELPVEAEEGREEGLIWNLRPRTLPEYVGQTLVVESIGIAIAAARARREPLEHVLFHGPPGLGKTTLAHIIAREMGAEIVHTSGPALEKPLDIVGVLSNLNEGEALFIDEIHRLPHTVEEYLYSAMEDFQVDFVTGKGAYARTLPFQLKRFTLIGATTRAGLLTPPLRDRFGMVYHLDFYSTEELTEVVKRSSEILGVSIDPEGASEIASRSRGTPRVANRLLRRVRDYAQVRSQGSINREVADTALDQRGRGRTGAGPARQAVSDHHRRELPRRAGWHRRPGCHCERGGADPCGRGGAVPVEDRVCAQNTRWTQDRRGGYGQAWPERAEEAPVMRCPCLRRHGGWAPWTESTTRQERS